MAKGYEIKLDLSGLLKGTMKMNNIIIEESRAMADEIGDFAVDEMRAIILTSGTGFSDAARAAGINKGPGRYRTGLMYNSVKHKVSVEGSKVSARYGWIGLVRKYFKHQDSGFKNIFLASYSGSGSLRVASGGPIVRKNPHGGYKNTPGMFALRDSAKSVESELPRFLKKYRGRITRRMNKEIF